MTTRPIFNRSKTTHSELSIQDPPSSTWDVFQQYAEYREDMGSNDTPGPEDYWVRTAASEHATFPFTFDELERLPLPPIDSPTPQRFFDRKNKPEKPRKAPLPPPKSFAIPINTAPAVHFEDALKPHRRSNEFITDTTVGHSGTVEEKKSHNLFHRAHERAAKSKVAVGKILGLGNGHKRSASAVPHQSRVENYDPEDFHFTTSPAIAYANRMKRLKALLPDPDADAASIASDTGSDFFPKPRSPPMVYRPLSSPPPILPTLTLMSAGAGRRMRPLPSIPTEVPLTSRVPASSRYTPMPFSAMASGQKSAYTPPASSVPIPF